MNGQEYIRRHHNGLTRERIGDGERPLFRNLYGFVRGRADTARECQLQ
jgi:hypothetical protein